MRHQGRLAGLGLAVILVAGCEMRLPFGSARPVPVAVNAPAADAPRPVPRPEAGTLPAGGGRTAAAFDTTTEAERRAASAPVLRPERELGRTVAALGDPAEPGFWARTPLVDEVQQGRLFYPGNGNSVLVELRPLDAAPGAGSQVSLPALRILGAPLTDLPELVVFAR